MPGHRSTVASIVRSISCAEMPPSSDTASDAPSDPITAAISGVADTNAGEALHRDRARHRTPWPHFTIAASAAQSSVSLILVKAP